MKRILSFAFVALLLMSLFSVAFAETEYSNPDMGLSITLPGGWKRYSDEELAELFGAAAANVGGERLSELPEEGQQRIVFYAINLTDGSTLNIIAQKCERDIMNTYKLITDEDLLRQVMEGVALTFEEGGVQFEHIDYFELPFSVDPAKKHFAASADVSGITMIQFMEMSEEILYTVSIFAITPESGEAAIAAFSPIA